jgi:hypothetical protein
MCYHFSTCCGFTASPISRGRKKLMLVQVRVVPASSRAYLYSSRLLLLFYIDALLGCQRNASSLTTGSSVTGVSSMLPGPRIFRPLSWFYLALNGRPAGWEQLKAAASFTPPRRTSASSGADT